MTAALRCSALDDTEDDFPTRPNLRIMSDQDAPREANTLAPDTDRAKLDTQPPGAADSDAAQALKTMLPEKPPLTLEDSYLDKAIRVVAEAGADARLDREERRKQHLAVMEAIRRSDENQTRNYEMLRDEVRHLKESDRAQDRRLAEGDERFAQIENSIESLKDELLAAVKVATDDAARRIGVLERELKDLRANAARPAETPPAVAT